MDCNLLIKDIGKYSVLFKYVSSEEKTETSILKLKNIDYDIHNINPTRQHEFDNLINEYNSIIENIEYKNNRIFIEVKNENIIEYLKFHQIESKTNGVLERWFNENKNELLALESDLFIVESLTKHLKNINI